MPLVSIVIPTYNRQDLLQLTIDSVFHQTYHDWELIVVDDGSKYNISQALEDRYGSRIRYVYQSNQGESVARNCGVSLSAGEYIAFLDDDDLWHPLKLQRQVDVLNTSPSVGLVSTQAYWINYQGLLLKKTPHGDDRESSKISWEDLTWNNAVAGGGSSALVRRVCLEKVGGFDSEIRFGEEWDLWLRLARHYEIRQIDEPLVYYRLHHLGARGWAPRAHEAEQMFIDHRSILDKAFADCPGDALRCKELRSRSIGNINLRHAIIDSALGRFASAHGHWSNALELFPEDATDEVVVRQQIVHYVTGYALLAKSDSQVNEIGQTLDRILDNLPAELAALKKQRHALYARSLAETAFLAAMYKEKTLARHTAFLCLISDAAWRRNVGLIKIMLTGGHHMWPEPITY